MTSLHDEPFDVAAHVAAVHRTYVPVAVAEVGTVHDVVRILRARDQVPTGDTWLDAVTAWHLHAHEEEAGVSGPTHAQARMRHANVPRTRRYPNPGRPDRYTTVLVEWDPPVDIALFWEVCNRCGAVVADQDAHDRSYGES